MVPYQDCARDLSSVQKVTGRLDCICSQCLNSNDVTVFKLLSPYFSSLFYSSFIHLLIVTNLNTLNREYVVQRVGMGRVRRVRRDRESHRNHVPVLSPWAQDSGGGVWMTGWRSH